MYLVYTPDGIVLVSRYYITCLNLSELVVLEPSSTSLYLEGRMLDLRTDTGLWSTLNQWGAPPPRAGGRRESAPRGRAVSPGLSAGKDVIAER